MNRPFGLKSPKTADFDEKSCFRAIRHPGAKASLSHALAPRSGALHPIMHERAVSFPMKTAPEISPYPTPHTRSYYK